MTSKITMRDEDYNYYRADVETDWGKTHVRTETMENLIVTLCSILPRFSPVEIILDQLAYREMWAELKCKGYSIAVKRGEKPCTCISLSKSPR